MNEFERIYHRYAGDIHRFVLYLSGDPALADDITSETLVRLWTSDEKIHMQTIKAYLFAIARHLYIDNCRAAARRAPLDCDCDTGSDCSADDQHNIKSPVS